jgi:hypothetical protein
MTISSEQAAQIAAHPVYGSVLEALPKDRPIHLTEILAEHQTHARQLATVCLVSSRFEHVLEGCRVLPRSSFAQALALLSTAEQSRLLALFVAYLTQIQTSEALRAIEDLPQDFKRIAWEQLSPQSQARLQALKWGRTRL